MKALGLRQALQLLDGAFASARRAELRPMGVVVVDNAGQVLACGREDGASALRLDIALGKAVAAVGMGADSRVLAKRASEMPVFYAAIASVAQQKFVPQTGAVLVRDAAGDVIGAIGASGGTGDEDEQICLEAIDRAGLSTGI